jgi:hypothetical protein
MVAGSRVASVRRHRHTERARESPSPAGAGGVRTSESYLLALQAAVGNQAVGRLLSNAGSGVIQRGFTGSILKFLGFPTRAQKRRAARKKALALKALKEKLFREEQLRKKRLREEQLRALQQGESAGPRPLAR